MDNFLKTFVFSLFLLSVFSLSNAQNCTTYSFANHKTYSKCLNLPDLNAFLHWNYHQANNTADIAYRQNGVSPSQWVCWALNLRGSGMVGSQCLVAFTNTSGLVQAYTSSVDSYGTQLLPSSLSFDVKMIKAELVNGVMILYGTLILPTGRTSFNQLWQVGPVSGNNLEQHSMSSANKRALGTVDFSSGTTNYAGDVGGSSGNVHGVLNVVSWGILMPLGAMAARYLKVFKAANPAWFYIHVTCQLSAYIIGVAGWGTGLKLGNEYSGIDSGYHGGIGLVLFILGIFQVSALLLRPKPDHKYRFYWNVYHHTIGYTVIILSIVNIFKGLDILDPEQQWKNAYIAALALLAITAIILEATTWFIVIKRKKADRNPNLENGTYGVHGSPDSDGSNRSDQPL